MKCRILPDLARVAITGDFKDLKNIPQEAGDADTLEGRHASDFAPADHSHIKSEIADFPALAEVAVSGEYHDLKNKPTALPANGGNADMVDGKHAADFAAVVHHHSTADIADFAHTHTPAEAGAAPAYHTHAAADIPVLSKVAVSGEYYDLKNVPAALPAGGIDGQVLTKTGNDDGQTDWRNPDVITGPEGKSAYQLWLEAGNTGSIAAFLQALKGDQGLQGETGPAGTTTWSGITGKPQTLSDFGLSAEINDLLAGKADHAGTLAGYGITDAYTKAQVDTALTGKASLSGASFTGIIDMVSSAGPQLRFNNPTGNTDSRMWGILVSGNEFRLRLINDAVNSQTTAMSIMRTGMTVDTVAFPAGKVGVKMTPLTTNNASLQVGCPAEGYSGISIYGTGGSGSRNGYLFGNNGQYGYFDYDTNAAAGARLSSSGQILFGINSSAPYASSTFTEYMRLNNVGNIGISTTNPIATLHVARSGNPTPLLLERVNTVITGQAVSGFELRGGNAANANARISYASMFSYAENPTAGSEVGALGIGTYAGGGVTTRIFINNNTLYPNSDMAFNLGKERTRWGTIHSNHGRFSGVVNIGPDTDTTNLLTISRLGSPGMIKLNRIASVVGHSSGIYFQGGNAADVNASLSYAALVCICESPTVGEEQGSIGFFTRGIGETNIERIRLTPTKLRPAINNSFIFGDPSARWSESYIQNGYFYGVVGVGTTNTIAPIHVAHSTQPGMNIERPVAITNDSTVGYLNFNAGNNTTASARVNYARLLVQSGFSTAGSESGYMIFQTAYGGNLGTSAVVASQYLRPGSNLSQSLGLSSHIWTAAHVQNGFFYGGIRVGSGTAEVLEGINMISIASGTIGSRTRYRNVEGTVFDVGCNVNDGAHLLVGGNSSMRLGVAGLFRWMISSVNSSFLPITDNSYAIGGSSNRIAQLFAATATINTSDRNAKTDIKALDLGLDFINTLKPVEFKYKVRQNEVSQVEDGTETVIVEPERTETRIVTPAAYETIEVEPAVYETVVTQPEVTDEEGNIVSEAITEEILVKEAVTEERLVSEEVTKEVIIPAKTEERSKYKEVVTPLPGKRTHAGLIAQEVEKSLNGKDIGIFTIGEDGQYGLRYEELIAPLIKAVQELSAKVEQQAGEIKSLKNQTA